MDNSPTHTTDASNLLPSPSSNITTPTRFRNRYQTTVIKTDSSSFKQVVQMYTGCPITQQPVPRSHSIPPIRAAPNKKKTSSSSRLYERRNSMKHCLKINPTHSNIFSFSPVTPLTPSMFYGAGSLSQSSNDPQSSSNDPKQSSDAEERAIKEKGFYLLPSPSTTPRDSEPKLLPLFPVTPTLSSPSLDEP